MRNVPVSADERFGVVGVLSATYHSALGRILNALSAAGYGDLSQTQLYTLIRLDKSGTSFAVLANRIHTPMPIVSNLIKILHEGGYVELRYDVPSRDDFWVSMTSKGYNVISLVKSEQKALEKEWAKEVGEDELNDIMGSLAYLYGSAFPNS